MVARAQADANGLAGYPTSMGSICGELSAGLSRWIGTDGYRALRGRALDEARSAHPVLDRMTCDGTDTDQIAAAIEAHGAAPVAVALEAFIASLIELLGRIVGDEMAAQLIESAGAGAQSAGAAERGLDD
jgi:hypothetical protein